MNGLDAITRWKNLKQRLSFKGLGCCGANWTPRTTIRTIIEEENDDDDEEEPIITHDHQVSNQTVMGGSEMNLGMALAAERNSRRSDVEPVKTLMRLIEETEGVDLLKKKKRRVGHKGKTISIKKENENENDWVCCVCMERSKGAAFIPCGHTYCRVCSREIWVSRSSCPICNRSIVEILDLF